MVRVRKLVLAIAAASAFSSGMAHALGLGEVTLKSALNQPLDAEIQLLEVRDLATDEVVPSLATQADFTKAGVDRQFFLNDLTFTPIFRPNGKSVVRVTSKKPVREPYLNFLVQVIWPNGRALREYTLLLDPPVYSPQAVAAVAPQLPIATPTKRPAAPVAPRPAPVTPTAAPSTVASSTVPGQYTTTGKDSLWDIAASHRNSGTVQQNMLAIQDLNPSAFENANINRLKSGQVLRLPDAQQVAARAQPEAVRQVNEQNAAWRQRPSAPQDSATNGRQLDATRRDQAGAAPSQTDGKDNLSLISADNKGAKGKKGDKNDSKELTNKLAVTQESLDTTRRDNAELKSRMTDLQSQLDKLQRLIQLKNDQLAKLQAEASSKGLGPVSATAPAAVPTMGPTAKTGAPDSTANTAANGTGSSATGSTSTPPATTAEAVTPAAPINAPKPEVPVAGAPTPDASTVAASTGTKPDAAASANGTPAADAPVAGVPAESPAKTQDSAAAETAKPAEGTPNSTNVTLTPPPADSNNATPATTPPTSDTPPVTKPVTPPAEPQAGVFDEILGSPIWLGLVGAAVVLFLLLLLMARRRREQQEADELAAARANLDEPDYVRSSSFGVSELDELDASALDMEEPAVASDGPPPLPSDPLGEADIYIAYGRFNQAAELLHNSIQREPNRTDLRLKLMEVYAELNDREGFAAQERGLDAIGGSQADIDHLKSRYPSMALVAAGGLAASVAAEDLEDFSFKEHDFDVPPAKEHLANTLDDGFDLSLDDLDADDTPPPLNLKSSYSLDKPLTPEAAAQADELNFAAILKKESGEPSLADELADFDLNLPHDGVDTKDEEEFLLDFEDDFNSLAEKQHNAAAAAELPADFDLSLDDEPAKPNTTPAVGDAELDRLMMSLDDQDSSHLDDLGLPRFTAEDAAAMEPEADFDFISDTDEASTKLDLARAYIDMGDREGARDILEEVMKEGTDTQQIDARKMLSTLG